MSHKSNWSQSYRETRFDGNVFQVRKRSCDCECHVPGNAIMHFVACCDAGWMAAQSLEPGTGFLS